MESCFLPAQLETREFEIIRKMVYEQTGIKLSEQKKIMVQSRLMKRLKEIGCRNFTNYIKIANQNAQEKSIMFNLITTNVTKFFREVHHFEFINLYLPEYLSGKKHNRVLKVWSAGCSTGQEPYTLAIVLYELFEKYGIDFQIIASDINTEVLRFAGEGIYKWEEVDEIPYDLLRKHFKLGEGVNKGLFKAKDYLRRKITFRQINLAENGPDFPVEGKFDLIFCRNVFIYFDVETKKRAIKKFYNKIYNKGCLFLGHSESLNTYDGSIGRWIPKEHTVYMKDEGEIGND